ncbi:uncharacterized protein LOC127718803 isoform X1 [Mytilus californianus]|uniref:uncharacterized protein LOC127718803 isoform X1 n=2 Tax=Mytilus californianus TaxID=6549 RepID=UPI0022451923|nr:uncharacterized protein LOC127718803 isoform X1 [Mytilus californianus]XP_052080831.1 uncharacterized protein LOC127718803 isoform X1 [Mytilus californianus]
MWKEATAVMLLKHTRICFWYLAFVSTYDAAFEIFEGKVIKSTNTSAIKFTCKTYQRPVGDSIVFLLNDRTTNVMRVYEGKCYDNQGECKNCTCSSSRNEITFTWMYIMTVPCHNCTFGADMSYTDENKRKSRNVNLYRVYNCKDLGPLQRNTQEVQHNTKQVEGMKEDGFVVPIIFICVTAIVICFITTILVLKRKQIKQRIRPRVKKQDTEEELLANTDMTHSACASKLCKPVQISVQLSGQITLEGESDIFGIISISKSKLVVADNFGNILKIYSDGQCKLKCPLLYKINGVTSVSEDVIAVTLVNNKNIYLYTLENDGCKLLDTIKVGYNIVDIASDKDYIVFEQKNENTKQTSLKIWNVKSKIIENIINVPYSNSGSNKLAIDMSSETIYACAENSVFAVSFKKDKDWSMVVPDPTAIVLVQAGENNRMVLVLYKNQNEIYRVSKNEVIRVEKIEEKEKNEKKRKENGDEEEEAGKVEIQKSSTFNRMTYNAELKQLFVQTAKNVISVYDITY